MIRRLFLVALPLAAACSAPAQAGDSAAVDAAVTALKSFQQGVHLIAGGRGKGSPYAPLVDAARGKVRAVYVIGEDAAAIKDAFSGVVPVVDSGDMDAAAAAAAAAAVEGDHVVLSPACASFDQFRDYGHRGERFRALFAAQKDKKA